MFRPTTIIDLPSLGLNSTEPVSLLYEAHKRHSRNDFTFYDYIKCLNDDQCMKGAVDKCLEIASNAQNPEIQKEFLKVIKFLKKDCGLNLVLFLDSFYGNALM